MSSDIDAVVAEPEWFAHRYDHRADAVRFVRLPRDGHRQGRFLKDREFTAGLPSKAIARTSLEQAFADVPAAPLHLILHSGLTCSTLLARALDRDGAVTSFNEPPILTDLVAQRMAGAPAAVTEAALTTVARLLARPFGTGEAVVVKVGSVGNRIGLDLLARQRASRALLLHAPLPVFLAAIARKGLWGRLWGRKLFNGLRNAGLVELGFSPADFFEQTDLQVAGVAWLAMQRMLAAATGAGARAAAIDSERLVADLPAGIAAVADHLTLPITRDEADAIVAGPLFARHAKSGEAFDLNKRAAELTAAASAHEAELGAVADWIGTVAELQRIPLTLPNQLRMG